MNGPEAIAELFTQVRGYTLEFLRQASDLSVLWTPPNLHNHTMWRSGHALWAIDCLAVELLTGRSELPVGWADLFCQGSKPTPITAWPERESLLTELELQRNRLLALLSELAPSRLAEPVPGLSSRPNLGGWILHAIHDEALHQGESFLSMKMQASVKT